MIRNSCRYLLEKNHSEKEFDSRYYAFILQELHGCEQYLTM